MVSIIELGAETFRAISHIKLISEVRPDFDSELARSNEIHEALGLILVGRIFVIFVTTTCGPFFLAALRVQRGTIILLEEVIVRRSKAVIKLLDQDRDQLVSKFEPGILERRLHQVEREGEYFVSSVL